MFYGRIFSSMERTEMKKQWGTIYNDTLRVRGYYDGMIGKRGDRWFTDMTGMMWSEEHVKFQPDQVFDQKEGKREAPVCGTTKKG
jgi:hypothetical protein